MYPSSDSKQFTAPLHSPHPKQFLAKLSLPLPPAVHLKPPYLLPPTDLASGSIKSQLRARLSRSCLIQRNIIIQLLRLRRQLRGCIFPLRGRNLDIERVRLRIICDIVHRAQEINIGRVNRSHVGQIESGEDSECFGFRIAGCAAPDGDSELMLIL